MIQRDVFWESWEGGAIRLKRGMVQCQTNVYFTKERLLCWAMEMGMEMEITQPERRAVVVWNTNCTVGIV